MSAGRTQPEVNAKGHQTLRGNLRLASRSQRAEGDSPREFRVIFILFFLLTFSFKNFSIPN